MQEMAFEQLENALVKDQSHPHSASGASSVTSIGKPRARTDSARNEEMASSPTFRDGQGLGLFDDDKDRDFEGLAQYPDPINIRSSARSKLAAGSYFYGLV